MGQSSAVFLVLLVAALAANLPYFSQRLLLIGPRRPDKGFSWRLLELLLLSGVTLGLGFWLEALQGQRHSQGWEFYTAFFCVYFTLGFPGFVWCYLRKGRHGR